MFKEGKVIETILKIDGGKIVHGDNLEVLGKFKKNSVDSCISDFPYAIEFMGKNWDSAKHWHKDDGGSHSEFKGTGYDGKRRPDFYTNTNEDKIKFYDWCYDRAQLLFDVMKSGGYVAIFGHPKTNHRMKCAFEDAGFKIVEEIDWVYLTGMPKNQDIGKLFDKKAGLERKVVGIAGVSGIHEGGYKSDAINNSGGKFGGEYYHTEPSTDLAKQWDGWKTAGLKPAHEPITIFQKPLEGTYIQNIEKYGCGGMNIDACRIPTSDNLNGGAYSGGERCDGDWKEKSGFKNDKLKEYKQPEGRFPANIVLDEYVAQEFDQQTGINTNTRHMSYKRSGKGFVDNIPSQPEKDWFVQETGGGSRMFTVIKYCPKVAPKERMLPNGERNPHVTLKPVELIKWLIKLLTPINGVSIDITAGSCTHAVACQELNKNDGYNLKWIDIELTNTEEEPYCNVGKLRVEAV